MARLLPYLRALQDHYGPPPEPPPGSPLEALVRALLSPGAPGRSLEEALRTLKVYDLLSLSRLRELDTDTLALAIQPAGRAHAKAARLKNFVAWFDDRFGGDPERLRAVPPQQLREELLGLGGIGPETADLVLLEGLGLPTAVVDRSTYRVLTRHELVIAEASYDDLRELVEKALPKDPETLGSFRSLTERVGREFCRPKPRCERCPLRPLLPESSPFA